MEDVSMRKFLTDDCHMSDKVANKLAEFFESNFVDVIDITIDNIEGHVKDFKEAYCPNWSDTAKNDIIKKLRDGLSKREEVAETKYDSKKICAGSEVPNDKDNIMICAGLEVPNDNDNKMICAGSEVPNDNDNIMICAGSEVPNDKDNIVICAGSEVPNDKDNKNIYAGSEVPNDVNGKNIINFLKTEYAASLKSDIFWEALGSYANNDWINVCNMLSQCKDMQNVASALGLDDISCIANADIDNLRNSIFQLVCGQKTFEEGTHVRVVETLAFLAPKNLKENFDTGVYIGSIKSIKKPKKGLNPIKAARDTVYMVSFHGNLSLPFKCWQLEKVNESRRVNESGRVDALEKVDELEEVDEVKVVDGYNFSVRCWTGVDVDVYIDDDACLLSSLRDKVLDRMREMGSINDSGDSMSVDTSKLGIVIKNGSTIYGKMDKPLNEYIKIGQYKLSKKHSTPCLYLIPCPPYFLHWHKDHVCLQWNELVTMLAECTEYFTMYQKAFAIVEECCKRAMINAGGIQSKTESKEDKNNNVLKMKQSIIYLGSLISDDITWTPLQTDLIEKNGQRNATDHNAAEIYSDHFKAMGLLDIAFRVLKYLCDIPAEHRDDWTDKHLEDARNRLVRSKSQIALENVFCDIIDKKIRYFVGRKEIIQKLQQWYQDTNKVVKNNECCKDMATIIYGNAGVGKSTLLAKLIKDDNLKLRRRILCYHICNAREPSTLVVSSFIVRIVDALKSKFPSYVKWYNSQGNEATRDIVKSLDRNDYRLDYCEDFQKCVTNGLLHVASDWPKVQNTTHETDSVSDEAMELWLIVIDSLDEGFSTVESNYHNNAMSITGLLLELFASRSESFPRWVKFVCTSRKIADVTNRVEGKAFEIDSESPSNYVDILMYKNERIVAYELEQCRSHRHCILCGLAQSTEYSVLSTTMTWQQSSITREMQGVFGFVCSFLEMEDIVAFTITCRLHIWRYNINFQAKFLNIVGGNFQYLDCLMNDLEKDNGSPKQMLGVESVLSLSARVPGDLESYYSKFFGIQGNRNRSRFVNKGHQLCIILSIMYSNNSSIRRDHLIDIAMMGGVSVEDCQYILDKLESILSRRLSSSNCSLHSETESAISLVSFSFKHNCTCVYSFYHESVVDWIKNDVHMNDYFETATFLTWMLYARAVVALHAVSNDDGTISLSELSCDDWNRNYNSFVALCKDIYPQWCKYLTVVSEVEISLFLKKYGLSHRNLVLQFLVCAYNLALKSDCLDSMRKLLTALCNQCSIGEFITKECAISLIHHNVEFYVLFDPLLLLEKSKQIAFRLAARRNNLNILRDVIVAHGADVNVEYTELFLSACWNGHVDVMKLLLSHGADVNAIDDDRYTPLHIACSKGYVDTAKVLLSHGADVNARDDKGYTPLHRAYSSGHDDLVKVLLSHGADVNARDDNRWTLLEMAYSKGHVDVVKVLLSHGADVNARFENRYTPLENACFQGNVDVVKVLLSHGADMNARDKLGNTPLHSACGNVHVDTAKVLLSHGADVNAGNNYGYTPLYEACRDGHVDVVKVLLSHGADVNAGNSNLYKPLQYAWKNGHVDVAKVLLCHEADVNTRYENGTTPLIYACSTGYVDVVKLLLSHGADMNARDELGTTPLDFACLKGHVDIVKLLLSHGADVNARYVVYTPLHIACRYGHVDIVKVLLCHGADMNAKSNKEKTPIEVCKRFDSIKLLVESGCALVPLADFVHPLDTLSLAYLLHKGADEFEAGRDGKLLDNEVIEDARKHIKMFLAIGLF